MRNEVPSPDSGRTQPRAPLEAFSLRDGNASDHWDDGAFATWAVIADAKNEAALRSYAHYGFMALPQTPRRLFLPMGTLVALFR